MYKFILRNYGMKKGKVLATAYNKECLYDIVRKIHNTIEARNEDDFIDLEKNGILLKTVYALSDGEFSYMDFENMEYYCKYDI